VNSLYPYVMTNFSTPIGKPKVFVGNIRKVEPDVWLPPIWIYFIVKKVHQII
jgi:hypothetical protein